MRSLRRIFAVAAIAALAAACGGETQPIAIVASSAGSLEPGSQRVLLALVDPQSNEFLASPDIGAAADFSGPTGESIGDVPLDFIWGVPDVRGLYRAIVDLPVAGAWSVTISADGFPATQPASLIVVEDTDMPQVGDPGPAVESATSDGPDFSAISSDPEPDPDFYRLSLDEAMADDRPTVVVFATPAFCTSETCGPVLDNVKQVAGEHPDVDFVHVEIYENLDADSAEDLITVPAVDEWGLPSEPWVFVTDAEGLVTARFEGAVDPAELSAAVAGLGA